MQPPVQKVQDAAGDHGRIDGLPPHVQNISSRQLGQASLTYPVPQFTDTPIGEAQLY